MYFAEFNLDTDGLQMFGGWNKKYKHSSDTLGCSMTFTVYYPPAAEKGKVPVRHLRT